MRKSNKESKLPMLQLLITIIILIIFWRVKPLWLIEEIYKKLILIVALMFLWLVKELKESPGFFGRIRERILERRKLIKTLNNYHFSRFYEVKGDRKAEKAMWENLRISFEKANEVRISGIAQFENLGKDYQGYLNHKERGYNEGVLTKNFITNISTDVKILLLYPFESDSNAREKVDKFIRDRIDEINEGKSEKEAINIEKYKGDIITTYKIIQELNKKRQRHKIQVVFYDHRPIFRYILFPDKVFFSPYLPGREGHETVVIECAKDKRSFYHSFWVLFESHWNEYRDRFQENII
jgi:hypothetical protein